MGARIVPVVIAVGLLLLPGLQAQEEIPPTLPDIPFRLPVPLEELQELRPPVRAPHPGYTGFLQALLWYRETLQLAEEQVGRIRSLRVATLRAQIERRAQRELLAVDLRVLLHSDAVDLEAIEEILDRMAQLEADGWKAVFRARLEARGLLTPAQRERLSRLGWDSLVEFPHLEVGWDPHQHVPSPHEVVGLQRVLQELEKSVADLKRSLEMTGTQGGGGETEAAGGVASGLRERGPPRRRERWPAPCLPRPAPSDAS